MAAVTVNGDFGTQQNQICHLSPSICHEAVGLDVMNLVFLNAEF